MLLQGGHKWCERMPRRQVPGSGEWLDVGWTWGCIPKESIVVGYILFSGSSAVQISNLSQQVGILPLPCHDFLRFSEQVRDPLYHRWVWTFVFALAKGCVSRRRGLLSGEHRFRCALVPSLSRSSPWRW